MLALLGTLTVIVLLAVIIINLLSPLVPLMTVPVAAALLGGVGLATSKLLDPIISRILQAAGARPTRIVVGTVLLALLIHLDGSRCGLFPGHHFGVAAALRQARHGQARPAPVPMTVGFPVRPLTSATFLIVGLAGIELGQHQRFCIPWLFGSSVLMILAAAALGILPF